MSETHHPVRYQADGSCCDRDPIRIAMCHDHRTGVWVECGECETIRHADKMSADE